jgi:hypothetical protein
MGDSCNMPNWWKVSPCHLYTFLGMMCSLAACMLAL